MHRNATASNGYLSNIAVSVGHGPPDPEDVRHFGRLRQQVLNNNPGRVALLTVVGRTSTPTAEAREEIVRLFQHSPDRLRSAFVLSSGGFGVAAQRAIATAVLMATNRREAILIAGSLTEALDWFARELGSDGLLLHQHATRAAIQRFCTQEARLRGTSPGSGARALESADRRTKAS